MCISSRCQQLEGRETEERLTRAVELFCGNGAAERAHYHMLMVMMAVWRMRKHAVDASYSIGNVSAWGWSGYWCFYVRTGGRVSRVRQ